MTANEFMQNLPQFPGYQSHWIEHVERENQYTIVVYWHLFSWPPPDIFWLMAENIRSTSKVKVLFRWRRREVFQWDEGGFSWR